jgi:hypothetical protein
VTTPAPHKPRQQWRDGVQNTNDIDFYHLASEVSSFAVVGGDGADAANSGIRNQQVYAAGGIARPQPAIHAGVVGDVDDFIRNLGSPRAAFGGDSLQPSKVSAGER